jgi:hypothetical protein
VVVVVLAVKIPLAVEAVVAPVVLELQQVLA